MNSFGDNICVTMVRFPLGALSAHALRVLSPVSRLQGFVLMDRCRLYVSYRAFTPRKGFQVIVGVTVVYVIVATIFLYIIMCDSVLIMMYNMLGLGPKIGCEERCIDNGLSNWTEEACLGK